MSFTYSQILKKAKECIKSVESKHELGINTKNAYYFAVLILNPQLKSVPHLKLQYAPNPKKDYISRQISKNDYLALCNYLVKFCKKNGRLLNYKTWNNKKIGVNDYTYLLARILVYYDTHKKLPLTANINSKAFTKPTEPYQTVYQYFVQKFGMINCIDDALDKIDGNGYGYYYDDRYSNKESIDRMKNGQGVNCTDSCQVFYNLGLAFIKQGKYKKVECLHIQCSGGDGHVRLRFTLPNGEQFYRDPACTLSDGGYCNWCINGELLAIDPYWFMQNLNR